MNEILNIIKRFSRDGALHREAVKNNVETIKKLLIHGFIKKVYLYKKVFYELTEKSLPLLELQRKVLLEEIKIAATLYKSPSIFHALLEDVRFLDENHEIAQQCKFLGDWQIKRPVVPSQLTLAKLRYYQKTKGDRQ
jgi:hypothetical protein